MLSRGYRKRIPGLILSNDSESQERRNVLVQAVLTCKVLHYDIWDLPLVKSANSCVVPKVKVHKVETFWATLSPVCKKPVFSIAYPYVYELCSMPG